MPGDIIHVMALGRQIIKFTKISIIDNLRSPILSCSSTLCDLFQGQSKPDQPWDNGVSACFLPGKDMRGPGIDSRLANTEVFCQVRFSPLKFRVC